MKRTIILTLCLAVLALAGHAAAVTIGYCNGEVASSTSIQMNGKGWTECGIKLQASALASYSGNSITAVRAGLVARVNVDTLRVWVRETLDGENLAEGYITRSGDQKIVKGWNEVKLDTPFEISEQVGDVYVGYSLHQRANVQAVSVVGEGVNGACFMKLGDADWQDIVEQGALSVEALVEGENVPERDLGISDVLVSPWPNGGATALRVQATLHNYGSEDITGFTLACSTEGISPITVRLDTAIASTITKKVTFIIRPSIETDEETPWTVTITGLANGSDQREANNSASATFCYVRNVLIEEFTTEKCVNCPRVAGFLHEVLERAAYKDCVFAVCHHAGYYTDDYTQPCDEELTWFYNEGGTTYAPAMMMNRKAYFETLYRSGGTTATFIPSSADDLASYLDYELAVTANVTLGVLLDYNEDSTAVTVTVTGRRNANYQAANPRVNVFLTEDEIASATQSGADANWRHQHVTRAYNSTWGDEVTWENNNFTYSKTFTLNANWQLANMNAVAWIYNYDSSDPTNCPIGNSAQVALLASGEEDTPTTTGDVNGDGEVSIADVNAIIDLILASAYTTEADVNGDGEVTIADVNAVVDIILNNE